MAIYVLITDPHVRKSFDIYNVLRRHYPQYRPLLASEEGRRTVAYGAKYTLQLRAASWEADLAGWLTQHPDDTLVYFPIEEDTTLRFYAFLRQHSYPNLCYALPDEATFGLVRDKYEFTKFCTEQELPAPRLYTERSQLSADNFVPVVAKPRIGSGSLGLHLIERPEQLHILDEIDWQGYVVQEMLDTPKDVKGGFFLVDQGQVIGYYGHQRIRTYPPEGGVTVFSRLDVQDELRQSGAQILGALNWHGLAMIEYLPQRGTGQFRAIEINPRAWGSILLSEVGGAQFIKNYIEMALGEHPTEPTLKPEAYIRWLLPYDVLLLLTRRVSVGDFLRKHKPVAYINISYTSAFRAFSFFLASVFNRKNLQKLWKKIRRNG